MNYGEMKLQARNIGLDEIADKNGGIRFVCPGCDKTMIGMRGDEVFYLLVHEHAAKCSVPWRTVATYPVETMMDGKCPECMEHLGDGGGRCRNVFCDNAGKAVRRCSCYSAVHPKIYKGDSTMRGR